MSQQIIIEMDRRYPFGEMQIPDIKVYVRKIVKYTKQNYRRLKQKFQTIRGLVNINIINLTKVLEEDGKFHLLYEYIPKKLDQLKYLSKEQIQNTKAKLIFLTSYIFFNKIETKFLISDLGFDSNFELKYYLDVEFEFMWNNEEIVKDRYMSEVVKISEFFTRYQHNTRKQANSHIYFSDDGKRSDLDRKKYQMKKQQNVSREKSIMSSRSNAIEILNNIELKIDQLRKNIKKSPTSHLKYQKSNYTKQVNNIPITSSRIMQDDDDFFNTGESVRINSKKQKVDHRKYSGDVNHLLPLKSLQKPPSSVRNQKQKESNIVLEKIHESREQEIGRKESEEVAKAKLQSRNQQKHTRKKSINPTTKGDFEEIKKEEFKNFYKSKQKYVHEFIDILTDQKHKPTRPKQQANKNNKDNKDKRTIEKPRSRPLDTPERKIATAKEVERKVITTKQIKSEPNLEKKKAKQLRSRINEAILKSDQALKNYRKHSASVEFKNKK